MKSERPTFARQAKKKEGNLGKSKIEFVNFYRQKKRESCRYLQNLLHQASEELYEANFLPFFFSKTFATSSAVI